MASPFAWRCWKGYLAELNGKLLHQERTRDRSGERARRGRRRADRGRQYRGGRHGSERPAPRCSTRPAWLSRRDSSTCTCICASPDSSMPKRSKPDRGPRRPEDSRPSAACRIRSRSTTTRRSPATSWSARGAIAVVNVFPDRRHHEGQRRRGTGGYRIDEGSRRRGDLRRRPAGDERSRDAPRDGNRRRRFDLPVINHCEDLNLSAGGDMHEGLASTRLGLRGIPSASEDVMVARDILLAELTGARYHVAHFSTKHSVAMVALCESRGLAVTLRSHAASLRDHRHGCAALRRELQDEAAARGRAAMWTRCSTGSPAGTVDALATDHAPHAGQRKDAGVREVPFRHTRA